MLVPQAFSFRDRFSPRLQSGGKGTINYARIDASIEGSLRTKCTLFELPNCDLLLLFPFSDDLSSLYEKSLRARTVIVHL